MKSGLAGLVLFAIGVTTVTGLRCNPNGPQECPEGSSCRVIADVPAQCIPNRLLSLFQTKNKPRLADRAAESCGRISTCRKRCEKYVMDEDGCEICECQNDVREVQIPTERSERAINYCGTTPLCRMYCKKYVVDENGCALCKCDLTEMEDISVEDKTATKEVIDKRVHCGERPMCMMYCKKYVKDENGCALCKCDFTETDEKTVEDKKEIVNTRAYCGETPMCKMYCKKYVKDENGCALCKCDDSWREEANEKVIEDMTPLENVIKGYCGETPLCKMYCKKYVKDANGCALCKCDYTWVQDENDKTVDLKTPKKEVFNMADFCGEIPVCKMYCKTYVKDQNGCALCKCEELDSHVTTTAEEVPAENAPELTERAFNYCGETPLCRMYCERYRKDENGCALCECD